MLYHRPAFALMDESTAALDVALEQKVMQRVRELNITCVSVAHRPTLLRYHDKMLELDGAGSATLRDILPADYERLRVRQEGDDVVMHKLGAAEEEPTTSKSSTAGAEESKRGRDGGKRTGSTSSARSPESPRRGASDALKGLEELLEARHKAEAHYSLDRKCWNRFRAIWRLMVPRCLSSACLLLLAVTVLTVVVSAGSVAAAGSLGPTAQAAITDDELGKFLNVVAVAFILFTILGFISAISTWAGSMFLLIGRRNVVRYLHSLYFDSKVRVSSVRVPGPHLTPSHPPTPHPRHATPPRSAMP